MSLKCTSCHSFTRPSDSTYVVLMERIWYIMSNSHKLRLVLFVYFCNRPLEDNHPSVIATVASKDNTNTSGVLGIKLHLCCMTVFYKHNNDS